MRHTSLTKKIDQHGNIISEAEEAITRMLNESAGEAGPQLLKDEEEEPADESAEDEDIDIESGGDELTSFVDGEPAAEDLEPETNTQPAMQVVSLEDVKSLLQSILQGSAPATEVPAVVTPDAPIATAVPATDASIAQDASAIPTQKGLVGGQDALKQVYFQGEGNETLDSEFDFTKDSANALESKVDAEDSYIDSINGLPIAYADFEEVAEQPMASIAKAADGNPHVYGGSTTYNDMDGGDFENPDMARLQNSENDFEIDGTSEYCAEPATEESDELLLDTEGEPEPEEEEMTEAPDDYDFEGEGHPDLHRIVGPIDPIEDEDEFEMPEVDEEPVQEPEAPAAVTTNSVSNIAGQQVQIVLTGVMITMPELNYIGESASKAGAKLKKISGKGNELQIVVEANNSKYIINYIDAPRTKEPTPFSVKNYKFGTLEEALGRITRNNTQKTQEVFSTIINESIANRTINEFKESDIFDGISENVSYVGTWTVKQVGTVNLKNGLNETYSNIIQHGQEPNTLVRTKEGEHYMIKGNLKERSKAGTRRELVDVSGKKSFGIAQVVGTFENSHKGLGQIMEKIRKTSIPLLVWK